MSHSKLREQSPFVVFGVSKSGTTWMQRIINAHPDICCHFQRPIFPVNEVLKAKLFLPAPGVKKKGNSAFGGVFENTQNEQDYLNQLEYISKINILQPEFVSKLELRGGTETENSISSFDRNLVTSLVQTLMRSDTDKKIVGTKSYTDLGQLMKYFPDSKVIHIIRDGRDVAVSKRFHYLRMGAYFNGDEKFWPLRFVNQFKIGRRITKRADRAGLLGGNWLHQPGETSDLLSEPALRKIAGEWVAVSNYIHEFSQRFPNNFLTIKYENLRSNTINEIKKIVEFIGADSSSDVLEKVNAATDFDKQKKGGFFRKGVAGDWTNHFTQKNRLDFCQIAGESLIRFGYEPDKSWASQSS